MTTIDAALQAHLQQTLTTLARLWLITRTDGIQLGFTDHSKSLVIGSQVFEAAAGFTPTALITDNTASVNNSEVESYLDSDAIASSDIRAGRYYDAKIEMLIVNWMDLPTSVPSSKAPVIQTGYIGEITAMGEDSFKFEVRGLTQLLQQKTGLTVQGFCQANLGDQNCKVNMTPYTFTNTKVTGTDPSNSKIYASSLTQTDEYFTNAKVTFTSGLNKGLSKEVLSHPGGGTLVLSQQMPFTIAVGDTFTAYAGCQKSIKDCNDKFSNIGNHWCGWPTLPGNDYLVSGKGGVQPTA